MQPAEWLYEQLRSACRHAGLTTPVYAFRFWLEETVSHSSESCAHCQLNGEITLVWGDGTVSNHRLSLWPGEPLPFEQWHSMRYLDDQLRHFAKAAPLSTIDAYDPQIAERLQQDSSAVPGNSSQIVSDLRIIKRTAAHSLGVYHQENLSEACFRPAGLSPAFRYQSRRLPTAAEWRYLQTEWEWLRQQSLQRHIQLPLPHPDSIVLFTPNAVRQLLQAYVLEPLHLREHADRVHTWLNSMAPSGLLQLRHDPSVPWSRGSYQFFRDGQPTRSFPLSALPTYFQKVAIDSFHWTSGAAVPFFRWLSGQNEVYVLDEIRPLDSFPFQRRQTVWVYSALQFCKGRPVATGNLLLPLSLPSLFSPQTALIHRPGWDGDGIAIAAKWLLSEP
ncbi:hypothetical protein [Brevibacillus fulvus]|uniref:Uncharacterized protein n=1 Tax=Brevibacillus fulvus TaxID=1125967 RepID=A0A938XWA2_9BACL|nr:hypothetical protein [Brevibacillus fulvus]MBM7589284.1 hypothetical protein [Brevibacillus fulvus]